MLCLPPLSCMVWYFMESEPRKRAELHLMIALQSFPASQPFKGLPSFSCDVFHSLHNITRRGYVSMMLSRQGIMRSKAWERMKLLTSSSSPPEVTSLSERAEKSRGGRRHRRLQARHERCQPRYRYTHRHSMARAFFSLSSVRSKWR